MTLQPGSQWYVVQTQPNAERKTSLHLNRQGFATYLPQYLKRRRHARRVETVPTPLFPRYLFVGVDMEAQRWRSIHSTVGVSRLICNGDAPAVVPDRIVAKLQESQDQHGFIPLDTRPRFSPGEKIRVLEGAFASCFGLFESMTDRERVAILLDFLGRKVRVILDLDLVAVA